MKNTADVLIRLHNINKSFDGQSVLNGISFDIKKNEFLTLLGPSGCGKTTILSIVGRILKATSGKVLINGKDIEQNTKYVGYMFTIYEYFTWCCF